MYHKNVPVFKMSKYEKVSKMDRTLKALNFKPFSTTIAYFCGKSILFRKHKYSEKNDFSLLIEYQLTICRVCFLLISCYDVEIFVTYSNLRSQTCRA